jgi:hypothetical protein
MPFIAEGSGGVWVPKGDIGIRQLPTPHPRFGQKIKFGVLESFGYAYPHPLELGTYDPPEEPLRVHAGATTDLASVPSFLWGVVASYGTHTMPALLHDRLCEEANACVGRGASLRRWADKLFRAMLRDEARAGVATRWAMWSAVRLFSWRPLGAVAVIWIMLVWTAAVFTLVARSPITFSLWIAVIVSTLVAIVIAAIRAREWRWEFSLGGLGEPGTDRRFSVSAFGSLAGASVVALMSAPLFGPVLVVNVLVWAVLRGLDGVVYTVVAVPVRLLGRWLLPYPRPDNAGVTSTGDTPLGGLRSEPPPAIGSPFPR